MIAIKKTLQQKIDILKKKYGFSAFGCKYEDLEMFTTSELKKLLSLGYIRREDYHKHIMHLDIFIVEKTKKDKL